MSYGYVRASVGRIYTIPLPKGKAVFGKALMVDEFKGISISPVLSKIFEHCVLNRLSSFLAAFGVCIHQYADNTQLYIKFTAKEGGSKTLVVLKKCTDAISD